MSCDERVDKGTPVPAVPVEKGQSRPNLNCIYLKIIEHFINTFKQNLLNSLKWNTNTCIFNIRNIYYFISEI